jgi:L-alanine-DL-glutamate epimerase-like enolase superfamily enzyme
MDKSPPLSVDVAIERWRIAGTFSISRGAKTEAEVVVVTISDAVAAGRGECVPYARYGETPQSVAAAVSHISGALTGGLTRVGLQKAMPAGAARNAVDCALWDLEAKRSGRRVWELAGLAQPRSLVTAFTISLDTPAAMADAAAKAATRPLLKIKLGGDGDPARIGAVRNAAPHAELIVDANEGWSAANLEQNLAACAAAGVTLIEQPLAAGKDQALAGLQRHQMRICADESVHDRASLAALAGKYDAINIKLDKTGGLTEALEMAAEATRQGLALMVGCMVGTSLAMAPALLLAQAAAVTDLDGPLLLAKDRPGGLLYDGSTVAPPEGTLWG